MNLSWRYILQQLLWLFGTGATLVVSMGVGVKWIVMTIRCVTFALLDLGFFLPNVIWYIFSPNVIHGVSYRSSQKTKLKNLEMLFQERRKREGSPLLKRDKIDFDGSLNAGTLKGKLDLESVEQLAATINPADGSFVNGLPVNVAEDISHLTGNHSFDDAVSALQKLYQRRHDLEEEQRKKKEAQDHAATRDQHEQGPESTDSFTESDDEEDEEDRRNLHNRAKLDIYLPVALDSLFRFMDQEKRNDDVLNAANGRKEGRGGRRGSSTRLQRKKFPVVISINGGAWIVGYSLWNFLIARIMAARGYVVFCPDYRNFPQTTMEGMTLDVSDAIGWVLNNAERYNGDLSDVTLMGQSAGAHLTMLSLLSQAQLCAYEATRMRGFDGTSVPPPSSVAYNVPRYNPRQSIHRYVGLSGIYNLERLVPHFHRRGLNTPVLQKIAGGKDQLPRYSIHAYFDRTRSGDTGEVLPDNFFDFLPQRMFFLHGDADTAAPVTESSSLVGVLRQAQMEFTLRRLTRNEENHRHAYRSRGLLPGALASPINFDPCSFSETRPAQEDGGGDGRTSCTDSSHGGKEEGGEDQRRPRKDGGKKDSRRGSASFPGEPRQSMALSPIVPPSRSDLPLTAVDLEFILIPDATHTDAIIEECIVANCSCCADFICDYFTDGSQPPSVASPVLPLNLGASWGGTSESPYTPNTARTAGVTAASYTNAPGAFPTFASDASTNETAATAAGVARNANSDYVLQKLEKVSRCSRSVPFCVPPDGILPMVVPPEDRPRVLNWITYFCPF